MGTRKRRIRYELRDSNNSNRNNELSYEAQFIEYRISLQCELGITELR